MAARNPSAAASRCDTQNTAIPKPPRHERRVPRRLGTINAVAERYDVSPKTVRKLISRGELAAYRLGSTRSIRVDLDEADELLRPVPTAGGGAA
jgi:excisionase family DNA binding protein